LVNDIIKSDNMTTGALGKLFADDGAYDNNNIFRYLSDNGTLPCIKVKKNCKVRLEKGHILRNLSVIAQKKDLQKWKDSIVSYRKRDGLFVETVFSCIKRTLENMCTRLN
jgi:hypothetical protein